jgi:hypothetical protein
VELNHQNADELHLNVGEHFWVEWFPCGDDEVFASTVGRYEVFSRENTE